MAFGDVLRGLGSVLNPAVAQEAAQEDAQQRGIAGQVGLMKLKQEIESKSPEYQARLEALKNEKAFREAAAQAQGDPAKIASAAVQYGKPDLALNLYKQQEDRAARIQQAADALEVKKTQVTQQHEQAMARITDAKEKQAEVARHNQALEVLSAQANAAKREQANLANQLKIMDLEMKGDKQKADKLRTIDTETTKLGAALEKANLPEIDAVLGAVEKNLDKAPQVAEYLSGPKSLLPDMAVPAEVQQGRQAFAKLFNITLKNRSGSAVTNQELERLKTEFATGALKTARQLTDAVSQARNIINKHYASVSAGFSPEALGNYNERIRQFGGRVVLDGGKVEDPLGIR